MKTPWHLWFIGAVSFLWNAGGALDYTMTTTRNAAYMGQFTPDQLDYFYNFPPWMMASWAIAVWGAVLGSVLLLMRSRHAVLVFAASLLGLVGASLYSFVLSDVSYVALVGPGAIWFTLAIAVVAVVLFVYARTMRQCKMLR